MTELPPVLVVHGVSKIYPAGANPVKLFWSALLGRPVTTGVPALHDVSFQVHRGEAFAVIGKNGAGKSTLLQIVAGTMTPTTGQVHKPTRVTNLLEIGTGFDQNYTGRENIFFGAALHGMSRKETERRIVEIEKFADIGSFIDRPINTYSSGMYLRLAFAIAVSMEPDLIVIDEAMAVGDVFFQQKCFARLRELKAKGSAILLVTHSMGDAQQFCERGMILQHGRSTFIGPAAEAVQRFLAADQIQIARPHPAADDTPPSFIAPLPSQAQPPPASSITMSALDKWPDDSVFLNIADYAQVSGGGAKLVAFALTDQENRRQSVFQQGEWARFHMEFELQKDIEVPYAGVLLQNREGIYVHGKSGLQLPPPASIAKRLKRGQHLRISHEIKLTIQVGAYAIHLGFGAVPTEVFAQWPSIPYDQGDAMCERLCVVLSSETLQVVGRQSGVPSALTHQGIADLEVDQILTVL